MARPLSTALGSEVAIWSERPPGTSVPVCGAERGIETVDVEADVDLRGELLDDALALRRPGLAGEALLGELRVVEGDQEFRQRQIKTDMDRRILERTAEVARETGEYDPRKLPKTLRVAMDSSPIEGAGRVEDTINLVGHAARKVVECAAGLLRWSASRGCAEAGVPALDALSVKRGLDIDWADPKENGDSIKTLTSQLESLERFIQEHLADEVKRPPLKELMKTLHQLVTQDLEPGPGGGGLRNPGRSGRGPAYIRRRQRDAPRKEEQALQRIPATYCKGY